MTTAFVRAWRIRGRSAKGARCATRASGWKCVVTALRGPPSPVTRGWPRDRPDRAVSASSRADQARDSPIGVAVSARSRLRTPAVFGWPATTCPSRTYVEDVANG